jgi:tetratricopeptide (TPR) repeat protein
MSDSPTGDQLIKLADKHLKKWSWLSPNKLEDAAILYKRASVQYKLNNLYEDATMAILKAADCYQKDSYEREKCYYEAARCSIYVNKNKAKEYFDMSARLASDRGDLYRAATIHNECGVFYQNNSDYGNAQIYFESAINMFEADRKNNNCKMIRVKLAYMLFENIQKSKDSVADINKIIELLEKVVEGDNQTARYNAKYYSDIILAIIYLGDNVRAKKTVIEFENNHASLEWDNRWKLVVNILASIMNNDHKSFQAAITNYNSILTLDNATVTILCEISQKYFRDDEYYDLC